MLWREASLDTVTSRRECADLSRSGWAAARFEVMRFPNPWRREFSQLLIENSFLQHRRASLRPDGRGRPSPHVSSASGLSRVHGLALHLRDEQSLKRPRYSVRGQEVTEVTVWPAVSIHAMQCGSGWNWPESTIPVIALSRRFSLTTSAAVALAWNTPRRSFSELLLSKCTIAAEKRAFAWFGSRNG